MTPRTTLDRRCSVLAVTTTLVLFVAITAYLPAGVRSSAIRPAVESSSVARQRRDALAVSADVIQAADDAVPDSVVREKRTLLKLKPLVVLPAKLALGAGTKLVHGAKLGVKTVRLGAKALGVGAVGLKAAKKVAKVTVKAATALGIKAVLLNFLFQKINQVIDFKTRLLGNLDQRNKQQNAQFLSPLGPSSAKSSSIGNKDYESFVPSPLPTGFIASADTQGFVTTGPSSVAINPGSDLIASPPPPGFSTADPQAFDSSAQALSGSLQAFGGSAPTFGDSTQGLGNFQSTFDATNDDGSPSLETSF